MPAQYPGNAISKAARAKTGGGFESAVEVTGGGGTDTPIANLPAGNILNDGFETADRSAPGADGFEWFGESGSIVTQDGTSGVAVYSPSGSVINTTVPDVDWSPLSGDYSLRISYNGSGNYEDPEQEFRLVGGRSAGETELWIRYALKVPENFYHKDGTVNNKLFAIQTDGYSSNGTGATVIWEYWGDENDPGGSKLAFHFAEGGNTSAGGHQQYTKFIQYPEDQNRWMYLCYQVIISSGIGVADGEIRLWRRWADESEWTLFHERTDCILSPPDPNTGVIGWKQGYLMGASPGMPGDDGERVNFLVDDFAMSTASLL